MTNERILSFFFVKGGTVVFRETCVLHRGYNACAARGGSMRALRRCGDGPRAPARIRARLAGSDDMWIYESSSSARFRAAQPLLASRAVIFGTTVELRTLGCAILAAVER